MVFKKDSASGLIDKIFGLRKIVSMDIDTAITNNPQEKISGAPEPAGNIRQLTPEIPLGAVPEVKASPAWKAYPIRGYIIIITVSVFLLYALNNLLNIYVPWIPSDFSKFFWNILNNVYNHVEIPHLSKAYIQCLCAINIALSFSIIGNFLLLIYRPRWFQYLVQAVLYGLGILAVYVVYAIYPFVFESAKINSSIKAVLIVGMAGLGTGLIIAFIRFIIALLRERRNRDDKIEPTTGLTQT